MEKGGHHRSKKTGESLEGRIILFILMDKGEQSGDRLEEFQGEGRGTPQSSHVGRYWELERREGGTEDGWLKPFTWNSWVGLLPLLLKERSAWGLGGPSSSNTDRHVGNPFTPSPSYSLKWILLVNMLHPSNGAQPFFWVRGKAGIEGKPDPHWPVSSGNVRMTIAKCRWPGNQHHQSAGQERWL